MKRWLKKKIGTVARFVARQMADELSEWKALGDGRVRMADELSEWKALGDGRVRIDVVDLVNQLSGNRVKSELVHLYVWNHRWMALLAERNRRTAEAVYDFIDREMVDAIFIINQFDVIRSKRDEMHKLGGCILDLGVYKGGSTRNLARIFPKETIHGFDSFEGLPEDWSYTLKGAFGDIKGLLPDMPDNVILHKGWFKDSLPVWKEENRGRPISILRIDCDIYSSTKTAFDILGDLLQQGSYIVFDELIGYRGWEKHEYKAFSEFIDRTGFDYTYIAYGLTYTIVRLG